MPEAVVTTGEQSDIPLDAAQAAEGERYRREEEESIVARLKDLREASASYSQKRHATIPRMRKLYYDQHDFSRKAAWQSKVWSPEAFAIVEKSVSLYSSGLIPQEKWFSISDEWRLSPDRARILETIQQRNLVKCEFYQLVRLMLQEGFLSGTIPLVVGVDSRGRVPEPSLTLWDPMDVFPDWSGREAFLFLRSEVEAYRLREWAEQGLYDEERVEEALKTQKPASASSGTLDEKILTVTLDTFYGDLSYGKDSPEGRWGDLIIGNGHTVIVNEAVLLRPLIPNPWAWGKAPVILGHPLRVPFRVWPAGLVEHVSGLARMVTEIMCALLDDLLFASMQVYQYDAARTNKADIQRGLYPGKLIGGDMSTGNPLIRPVEPGRVPVEAFSVLALLSKKIQEATGITEHTTGNVAMSPSSRRATATEINRYLTQSLGIIRTMAKDLEISCFEPLLDLLLSVFAQVTARSQRAWYSRDMAEALGPQATLLMASLQEEHRAEVLTRGVRHKARGVSGTINLEDDLRKLMAFGMAAKADPEMWAMVNKRRLLEELAKLNRQDPQYLLYSEQEVAQRQAVAQQAMARQAMMAAMAGGAGRAGGPGTAPQPPQRVPRPAPSPMLPAMAGMGG